MGIKRTSCGQRPCAIFGKPRNVPSLQTRIDGHAGVSLVLAKPSPIWGTKTAAVSDASSLDCNSMSGEVTRSTKVLITAARLDPSGRVSIASSKRRHAKLVPICKYIGSLRAGTTFGRGHMHEHSDYLRDQATKFWELAAQANDPVAQTRALRTGKGVRRSRRRHGRPSRERIMRRRPAPHGLDSLHRHSGAYLYRSQKADFPPPLS